MIEVIWTKFKEIVGRTKLMSPVQIHANQHVLIPLQEFVLQCVKPMDVCVKMDISGSFQEDHVFRNVVRYAMLKYNIERLR